MVDNHSLNPSTNMGSEMFANKSKMLLYLGTPTNMNKYKANHADQNNKLPRSIIRQMCNLAADCCCVAINHKSKMHGCTLQVGCFHRSQCIFIYVYAERNFPARHSTARTPQAIGFTTDVYRKPNSDAMETAISHSNSISLSTDLSFSRSHWTFMHSLRKRMIVVMEQHVKMTITSVLFLYYCDSLN